MTELEILDLENQKLLEHILILYREIVKVELIHYKSENVYQARKRNEEYSKILKKLQDKIDDIYDI